MSFEQKSLFPGVIMRRVLVTVDKAEDLEVHFCVATLDDVTVLDVREFVPSTGAYGRGTTVPWSDETLHALRAGLRKARVDA